MAIIRTNDPAAQPTPIAPTSLGNVTWPAVSDTLSFRTKPKLNAKGFIGMGVHPKMGNARPGDLDKQVADVWVALEYIVFARDKKWIKLFQDTGRPTIKGGFKRSFTTGTNISKSEEQSWSSMLGLTAGFSYGGFNASVTAEFTNSGTVGTQIDVKKEYTTEWSPGWEPTVPSVYVGQQLAEEYYFEGIRFLFKGALKNASQISPEMQAACENWAATGTGRLPDQILKVTTWTAGRFTDQTPNFHIASFPPDSGVKDSLSPGGAMGGGMGSFSDDIVMDGSWEEQV